MKIDFGKTFSVTPAQLKDGIAQGLIDGYIDHIGRKSRLGLTLYTTIGTSPIDGLFVNKDGIDVAVTNGTVYVGGVACTGNYVMTAGNLCTFAEDSTYIFIGHGGEILKVDPVAKTVSVIHTTTSPDNVTHVAVIQGYLVCNGTGGVIGDTFYTGPSTTADYLSVFEVYNNESLPDGLLAIMEDGQFIYNFGSNSVEISNNDGVTPWAKYSLGYIPYGIHAPHSVAKVDNTFIWLGAADNALRIIKIQGGKAATISTPYDTVINAMTTTSDAYGFVAGFDGHTFYILQFPTEEKTLVYHYQMDAWYQWQYWNQTSVSYKPFLGRCHAYNPTTNTNMIGSRVDGKIGTMTGFTDFGDLIRFELTSGNITGGTYLQKRAGRMRFQLQRGVTTSLTAEPYIMWQHRDDGNAWSPERKVSLGLKGHYDYIGQLDRNGVYRERQHRIIFTETTCQLVLVDVEEETKLTEKG